MDFEKSSWTSQKKKQEKKIGALKSEHIFDIVWAHILFHFEGHLKHAVNIGVGARNWKKKSACAFGVSDLLDWTRSAFLPAQDLCALQNPFGGAHGPILRTLPLTHV